MKYHTAVKIYESFRRKYPRATEFILRLYKITDNYLIDLLLLKKWQDWYRFKVAVKHAERNGWVPETTIDKQEVLESILKKLKNINFRNVDTRQLLDTK